MFINKIQSMIELYKQIPIPLFPLFWVLCSAIRAFLSWGSIPYLTLGRLSPCMIALWSSGNFLFCPTTSVTTGAPAPAKPGEVGTLASSKGKYTEMTPAQDPKQPLAQHGEIRKMEGKPGN